MRIILPILICLSLTAAGATPSLPEGDTCYVYVVDVKAARRFMRQLDTEASENKSREDIEAAVKAAGYEHDYDKFVTKVGEEELTTRTFPFPRGNQVITASVFYTDELMASNGHSDSMLLAIYVGQKASKNAIFARGAAVAEVSYDDGTDMVRVKKNVTVDGRRYLVGLECKCKKPVNSETHNRITRTP
jgi:hypothetical protein